MNTYCYLRLKGAGRDHSELRTALADEIEGVWRSSGVQIWGIWEGLFGVPGNELLVVATAVGERTAADFSAALTGSRRSVTVEDQLLMVPTVRPAPEGFEPRSRPGLYVFRFFRVVDEDVDEIAALSKHAWETFENSTAYAAEPQALFRPCAGEGGEGRMLLVTWYDGFQSWETSRRPAPEAMANFRQRRKLTRGTLALATRLLEMAG